MTVSEYLLSCKLSKLTIDEMKFMTLGMCLDHIEEYSVLMNPEIQKEKEATQTDIQRLKGR